MCNLSCKYRYHFVQKIHQVALTIRTPAISSLNEERILKPNHIFKYLRNLFNNNILNASMIFYSSTQTQQVAPKKRKRELAYSIPLGLRVCHNCWHGSKSVHKYDRSNRLTIKLTTQFIIAYLVYLNLYKHLSTCREFSKTPFVLNLQKVHSPSPKTECVFLNRIPFLKEKCQEVLSHITIINQVSIDCGSMIYFLFWLIGATMADIELEI